MLKSKSALLISGLALLVLAALGCKIVSGTFVVVESFSFTTKTGFYPTAVDLTENDTWQDHKDDIDRIEVVGFELWITNNETSEWTYTGYVNEATMPDDTLSQGQVEANATRVFGPLTVPAGTGGPGCLDSLAAWLRWTRFESSCRPGSQICFHRRLVRK